MVANKVSTGLISRVVVLTMLAVASRANALAEPGNPLSGRVISGDIPIPGSVVTLCGTVATCPGGIMGGCVPTITAIARTKTNSQGQFTIDASKSDAELGSLLLIARGGDAGAG